MNAPVSLIIVLCGVLYGLITLLIEIIKTSTINKNQLGLSIALIVSGVAIFIAIITNE